MINQIDSWIKAHEKAMTHFLIGFVIGAVCMGLWIKLVTIL